MFATACLIINVLITNNPNKRRQQYYRRLFVSCVQAHSNGWGFIHIHGRDGSPVDIYEKGKRLTFGSPRAGRHLPPSVFSSSLYQSMPVYPKGHCKTKIHIVLSFGSLLWYNVSNYRWTHEKNPVGPKGLSPQRGNGFFWLVLGCMVYCVQTSVLFGHGPNSRLGPYRTTTHRAVKPLPPLRKNSLGSMSLPPRSAMDSSGWYWDVWYIVSKQAFCLGMAQAPDLGHIVYYDASGSQAVCRHLGRILSAR